jgi:hypothetical protein
MMDPRIASDLNALVEERFRQLVSRMPAPAYGVVESVDAANRRCSVYVSGHATPSAGFKYGAHVPAIGELVRVVVDPRGDRYVDEVISSTFRGNLVGNVTGDVTGLLKGFNRLRHVPLLNQTYSPFSAASTTVAADTTAEFTMLPSDGSVRLVHGVIIASCTSASQTGTSFRVRDYNSTAGESQGAVVYTPVASSRLSSSFLITVGGVNNRSFRYEINVAAGTLQYWIQAAGYFTDA